MLVPLHEQSGCRALCNQVQGVFTKRGFALLCHEKRGAVGSG